MAIPTKTLDEIERRARAHFRAAFPSLPVGPKRFLGRMARALSLIVWGLHKAVEDISDDIVPSTSSSTDTLTEWATLLGLPDGQGGIGRLLPLAASGGAATLTGVAGTVYPDGSTATGDGVTIRLVGAVTIPGTAGFGSVFANFISSDLGAIGNLPAGTSFSWDNPPAGADSSFILTSPLTGGDDTETNAGVFARIQTRLQTPRLGGSAEDIREWLSGVDGVQKVYVYPARSGTGTVDVILDAGGSGYGRAPSPEVIQAASAVLEAKRSVGAVRYYVRSPSAIGHDIRVRVSPASGYSFDWSDGGGCLIYGTSGTTTAPLITLSSLAPDSLKTAINNYSALIAPAPRLQINGYMTSLGQTYNVPIRATGWTDAGGKTTLTLESAPDGWLAAGPGDTVYSYSDLVPVVANSIIAYVDSLGPSRSGGHADKGVIWPDMMTLSGVTAAAENALDLSGLKPISEVIGSGVTIDGVASDVQGADNTVLSPQILYVKTINVTQ